jgi:hypothetical protein
VNLQRCSKAHSPKCLVGKFSEVHIHNPALFRSSRVSKGWLAPALYERPPHVGVLDRNARSRFIADPSEVGYDEGQRVREEDEY